MSNHDGSETGHLLRNNPLMMLVKSTDLFKQRQKEQRELTLTGSLLGPFIHYPT